MIDKNCPYCMNEVSGFAYPVCELPATKVYVFKEQSHPGRCIVASKHHVSELINLSDEERDAFFADMSKVSQAIHDAYGPEKVNYGSYHDTGCHMHFHLVPKYKDDPFEWTEVFAMNPHRKEADDAMCEEIAEKLRSHIK